jgi:uncharacterized protein (TIGR02118 family)
MIKLVYVIRKRGDVSEKEFHDYWLNRHGPLVRSFAAALRARRYVQSHTVSEDAGRAIRSTRGMTETYDGITEVWWDSLEDFGAGADPAEREKAARALLEDESKFIDFQRSSIFLTEEHEIFDLTR